MASQAPGTSLAWDAGTGSGQAATGLAAHFREVVATDASHEQLTHAAPHPRVRYVHARAEAGPGTGASCDAVTVAQALHWFDLDAFWTAVHRAARPGAFVAAWCYTRLVVDPAIDPLLEAFRVETMGPWWPPERVRVEREYADLPWPFVEVTWPAWHVEATWTLDELIAYHATWSSVQRHRAAGHADPLPALRAAVQDAWGDPALPRLVRWPIRGRAGHLDGSPRRPA